MNIKNYVYAILIGGALGVYVMRGAAESSSEAYNLQSTLNVSKDEIDDLYIYINKIQAGEKQFSSNAIDKIKRTVIKNIMNIQEALEPFTTKG